MKKAEQFIDELIQQQALPETYKDLVGDYLWPLVQDMANIYQQRTNCESNLTEPHNSNDITPWLVGLQGTQGSGKSTVCLFIKALLERCFDFNVVILSVDDFYKTHEERQLLSKSVHPLLVTRGVPGTHDLDLAITTLQKLSSLQDGQSCHVPSFNKAIDDRTPETEWPKVFNKVDIVLFEGWCMGVTAQTKSSLAKSINELEKKEDLNGLWREYVNKKLNNEYKEFFKRIDNLVVLQAPSFKCVYQWRLLQEEKLAKRSSNTSSGVNRIQTPEQIERFISHYERLTRHALNTLSEEASWVIKLDEKHNMKSLFRNNNLVRLE